MKGFTQIIHHQIFSKSVGFFNRNFNWVTHRQDENGNILLKDESWNKIIKSLNYFWLERFDEKDKYSVKSDYLLICLKEEEFQYFNSITVFSAIVLDSSGLNTFKTYWDENSRFIEAGDFYYQSWIELDKIELGEACHEPYLRFYLVDSMLYNDVPLKLFNVKSIEGINFLIKFYTGNARFVQSINQL
ncbi:hypothetical protein ADIWIN_3110 [Winogradskyella psychrotolerans RS-3]|uniref:Uncharacterized protein n=1 Tax=Winogradskyella psychrotolerans RS-3 TaxID=641526 RepID=S7VR85_9FLAO|nr:hypothetical protein [Winogradskyella psychrotolerans]EPR71912.1 hypothetical protein ADIWIN_3110 [Winogradskyella psychrotolerans RS-3]